MDHDGTDGELARRIASGGAEAERAEAVLYQRFARRIELYGRRHLGSAAAARDLVQQVMLRVLEALRAGRLADPARLASFVLGTCRNVSWDTRRAEQRQRRLERSTLDEELEQPPAAWAWREEGEVARLFTCMNALPEREGRVMRLSFWEDCAADEIGQRLGLSAGNVRVIRHRALHQLARCLEAEEHR